MVKQIPQQDKTTPPEAFAVIPSDLIRDPNLSATAKAAYCLIDDRQGNRPYVRVSHKVLVTDLQVCRRTVIRVLDELETAGWLVSQVTGRTKQYATINSARNRRVMWQIVHSRGLRCDKNSTSDVPNSALLQSNNSLGVKKQASNSAEPAAAALVSPSGSPQATTLDAFIERFIGMSDLGLERNRRTSAALSAAMSNGWQPEALAVALRDMKRSANAGTGVIVGDLEKLAGTQTATPSPQVLASRQVAPMTKERQAESRGWGVHPDTFAGLNLTLSEPLRKWEAESGRSRECEHDKERGYECALCTGLRSNLTRDLVVRITKALRDQFPNYDIALDYDPKYDGYNSAWGGDRECEFTATPKDPSNAYVRVVTVQPQQPDRTAEARIEVHTDDDRIDWNTEALEALEAKVSAAMPAGVLHEVDGYDLNGGRVGLTLDAAVNGDEVASSIQELAPLLATLATDLDNFPRLSKEDYEHLQAKREAAEREAAERFAKRVEAERVEAERVEAERVEKHRLEQERYEAAQVEKLGQMCSDWGQVLDALQEHHPLGGFVALMATVTPKALSANAIGIEFPDTNAMSNYKRYPVAQDYLTQAIYKTCGRRPTITCTAREESSQWTPQHQFVTQ